MRKLILIALMILPIIIPSFTIDASAATQVGLRIETVPGNLVHIDGDGKYDKGTVVKIAKAPEEFEDYVFLEWRVDSVVREGNPINVTMDKAYTAVAVYSDKVAKITIDSSPRNSEITVDGTLYLPSDLPLDFEWDISSKYEIDAEQIITKNDTRYVFTGWNDLEKESSRNMTITESKDLKALYKTEYLVLASSPYGQTTGSGWYEVGKEAAISISSTIIDSNDDGVRHVFSSWSKGLDQSSPVTTLIVTEPTIVVAKWDEEYLLKIGSTAEEHSLKSEGWYAKDSYAFLSAPEEFVSKSKNIKYTFSDWTVNPNLEVLGDVEDRSISIKMDNTQAVWTNFDEQYYLEIDDPFGVVQGEGFYAEGATVPLQIGSSEIIIKPDKVRVVVDGFEGLKDVMFTEVQMDGPKTVNVEGTKQYYLDISSKYGGTTGSGWYNEGEYAHFRVIDLRNPAGLWTQYLFDGWNGDYSGKSQRGTILMDEPKKISVSWSEDGSVGYLNSAIIAGILGGGGFLYFKFRKKWLKPKSSSESDDKNQQGDEKPSDPSDSQQVITITTEGEKLEENITKLKSEKESKEAEVSQLKLEEEELALRVAKLKTKEQSYQSGISTLKSEEEYLEAKITKLNSEKEHSKSEWDKYKKETDEIETKLEGVQNQIDSKKEELDSLISQQQEKENKIDELKNEIDSKQTKLSNEEDKKGYDKVVSAASSVIASMNKKYKDLQKELEITKAILDKKKTEYDNISSKLDKSSSEFDSIDSSGKKLEKKN